MFRDLISGNKRNKNKEKLTKFFRNDKGELQVKRSPKRKNQKLKNLKQNQPVQVVSRIFGLYLIEDSILVTMHTILTNRIITWVKNYLDRIKVFLQDYPMQTNR